MKRLTSFMILLASTVWITMHAVGTKLLQKSGIRKNEVIELIYRGFI